jgi:ferritin-like metal-binding protein YciE
VLETSRDLFVHRLRTMLCMEQTLAAELLPAFREHVHGVDLQVALERHMLETEQHARTLDTILRRLGASPEPVPSATLAGLRAEHDTLMQLVDIEHADVVDLMHAELIASGEHLELASYASLVAVARALGEEEIATLLEGIREQEEHALELVHRAAVARLAETVDS